jgi:hypothetical protein
MTKTTTAFLLLGVPFAAYGYTDPGTGVFLYQAILATVVGAGWTARRLLTRLFSRGPNLSTQRHDRVAGD